jgi:fructose-1,6-bisphosphatase/inositol monophosphatase family enzyme
MEIMTTINTELKRMQDAAIVLVREVAQQEVIPRFLRARHALKDDGTLFSEADLAAQHYLADRLPEIHDSPIIGEEMSRETQRAGWDAGNEGLWCIDPIDGTTNFINGIPWFAVSLAWMRARRTRLAVTYNPITDEMFYAREGHGAYLNGRRLPLRQVTPDIGRAVAGVDFKRIPKGLADRIAVSPPYLLAAQLRQLDAGLVQSGCRPPRPLPAWRPDAVGLRRRQPHPARGGGGLAGQTILCTSGGPWSPQYTLRYLRPGSTGFAQLGEMRCRF